MTGSSSEGSDDTQSVATAEREIAVAAERAEIAEREAQAARADAGEARTDAGAARREAGEARTEAGEAHAEAGAASADADDATTRADTAVAQAGRASTDAGAARADAQQARHDAHGARVDAAEALVTAEAVAEGDPLLDTEVRAREAGADEENPFGRLGRPLARRSPLWMGFTGAVGAGLAYLLYQAITGARGVFILILTAAFLAIGLDPVVAWLERRGLSRRMAIATVFALVILFFVGFGLAIVPPVAHQAASFNSDLPSYINRLRENSTIASLDRHYHFLAKAQQYVSKPDFGTTAVGGVVGLGKLVLSGVFSGLTVLILTLYFLSSLPGIKETAYRMVPRSRRARVSLLGDEILGKVGGYVAGALTIAAVAGVAAFLFLLIAGAPYPLALAMLIAITDVIPLIGATLGAIAVTAICLFVSLPLGIASLVFFTVYQQVENYLIYPRVMGRSVDVNPAATIVAALLGGALLGIVGALLAIPTAAAISLFLREVVVPRQESR